MTTKYNKGDRVEFDSIQIEGLKVLGTIDRLTYDSAWIRYICPKDKREKRSEIENERIHLLEQPYRVKAPLYTMGSSHAYKVGDIIKWNTVQGKYKILSLDKEPDIYEVRNVKTGKEWTNQLAKPRNTHIAGTSLHPEENEQSDKCKWRDSILIDVEPIYYRLYDIPRDSEMPWEREALFPRHKANQHDAMGAIMVKRAQSYGLREVPICNVTGDPVEIIAVTVKDGGEKYKAEAHLYCDACDTI